MNSLTGLDYTKLQTGFVKRFNYNFESESKPELYLYYKRDKYNT